MGLGLTLTTYVGVGSYYVYRVRDADDCVLFLEYSPECGVLKYHRVLDPSTGATECGDAEVVLPDPSTLNFSPALNGYSSSDLCTLMSVTAVALGHVPFERNPIGVEDVDDEEEDNDDGYDDGEDEYGDDDDDVDDDDYLDDDDESEGSVVVLI